MASRTGSTRGPDQGATVPLARGARAGIRIRECTLVVVEGPDQGARFEIARGSLTVGKAAENDIVLADPSISRQHLRIQDRPDGWLLTDLGSTNGTLLDGTRVKEAYLTPGASIRLGSTRLRFEPGERTLEAQASADQAFGGAIGRSPAMRTLFGYLERVAPTDLPVLLGGETGTGKEVLARAVHDASARKLGPYAVFDCASTEPGLMGAALFGHEKGAFTGAAEARRGAFQTAHGGTLFIDEVGELPLDLQPKLLRVLEQREVQPVGRDQPVRVDVRVISATHRDLPGQVARGAFRQDLYYRLAGISLAIPALRERPEDVVPLAERFLAAHGRRVTLGPSARAALEAHPWPGNVRELRNAIDRAVALAQGEVLEAADLLLTPGMPLPALAPAGSAAPAPASAGASSGASSPPAARPVRTMLEAEADAIRDALASTSGNRKAAARLLGIAPKTLRDKIVRYGLGTVGEDPEA